MKKQIYVIEHLEPKLFEWCLIEYEHISQLVGKNNLWFTNIRDPDKKKLEKFGKVFSKRVWDLGLDINKICVLDPESDILLEPSDSDVFDYFLFGGILGDYPPRKRTKEELTSFIKGASTRNIGKEQMSTDNALFTVKKILDGSSFSKLKFVDGVSIKINEFENVDLPYRYNIVNNRPYMSSKIRVYLKKKKGF